MSDPAELAKKLFAENHNCAQSVLCAFAPQYGLDRGTAASLATAFGGGMSRRGETCGAVSGALMVLGLAYGAAEPESKEKVYSLGQAFLQQFEEKHGSHFCRDLIGVDISTPEGLEKAHNNPQRHDICSMLVRDAALIVESLLTSQ